MAWAQQGSTYFLGAGQTQQFWFGFNGSWRGPQFAQPRPDGFLAGLDRYLVVEWQGTWTRAIPGGTILQDYLVGVHNDSSAGIYFHLEGGGVT